MISGQALPALVFRVSSNARFPLGPSAVAFALKLCGSILVSTGPALRDLAGRQKQDRGDQVGARLRPGTEWFVIGSDCFLSEWTQGIRKHLPLRR